MRRFGCIEMSFFFCFFFPQVDTFGCSIRVASCAEIRFRRSEGIEKKMTVLNELRRSRSNSSFDTAAAFVRGRRRRSQISAHSLTPNSKLLHTNAAVVDCTLCSCSAKVTSEAGNADARRVSVCVLHVAPRRFDGWRRPSTDDVAGIK